MASPLLGSIAKSITAATAGIFYPVTVSHTAEGGYVPGIGPVPGTTTDYPCKGMIEDFDTEVLQKAGAYLDGSLITPGDHKVTIAATTLAMTPAPSDKVTVKGTTYTIASVSQDAAGAIWAMTVR